TMPTTMTESEKPLRAGDIYLARLLARAPYRWTLYAAFLLTGAAALYLRVVLGRADQALPWFLGLLGAYGFVMAVLSADLRCRLAYFFFGLLVALAFSRGPLAGQARLAGVLEVVSCLLILAMLASLARDDAFRRRAAVLESPQPD
ncbi:MAG TPA: hypothetical protein VFP98_08230, partial [Candidatus Polarisedimenticolia bacterium]|nr:hypothetical protein [Candidatus Polarisedimenticolia bacterium]